MKQNQSLAHQLRASTNQLFNEELNHDSMNPLSLAVTNSQHHMKGVIQKGEESPDPQPMGLEDKQHTIYK